MARIIDGETLKNMMICAADAIDGQKIKANELNVFPVPDGDTGTNMSLTMLACKKELSKLTNPSVEKAADVAAASLLRGARGNSGVILSLLFRGFSKRLKGLNACDGVNFAYALKEGVASAYQAVMKPAEGTILTVSRMAAEAAVEKSAQANDFEKVMETAIAAAKDALERTPEQNPVLKKAGVVDSGGFGFVTVLDGMYAALMGRAVPKYDGAAGTAVAAADGKSAPALADADIKFAYCTEFIAQRNDHRRSVNKLREFLQNIGDSAVVVADDEIVKVHVHTNGPDKVIGEGLKFGPLLTIKIENMREQHTEIMEQSEIEPEKPAEPQKKYGFVAVAAGDGIINIFNDLGTDQVVSGGQTMNPSTEDILVAVEKTPARTVFVLPNNKNIIMAAEQAALISTDKQIIVIPTATIPQGISAMLAFDPEMEQNELKRAMIEAAANVKTGQITYAVRDSDFEGKAIRAGDYLALLDNKLYTYGKNCDNVVKKLAKGLLTPQTAFITIMYGENVSEKDASDFAGAVGQYAPDAEINVVYGGQPVYYFIISAE